MQHIKHIHIIAIGGVSMSAIAEYLLAKNILITGSDREKTPLTQKLENLGIKIYYNHNQNNITPDINLVVRNSAIGDDNPEIIMARKLNIPIIERKDILGQIMKDYKNVICFAGTHGKTTTTSMMTNTAIASNLDATIMVGSPLKILDNKTLRIGAKNYFIAEACEYCNAFLSFAPTIAVILNIDEDHLDFFKDINDICNSFKKYALKVPKDTGFVVANFDDENVYNVCKNLDRNVISFGISDANTIYPSNIKINKGYYSFDVFADNKFYTHIDLSVPGEHNLLNALSVIATCYALKINGENISLALSSFTGATRRFEKKGTINGADIIDDYAHHPSEIIATIKAARQMGYNRIIVAFQSHTYTRTNALYDEFVSALNGADKVFLMEIYSARETDNLGVSSEKMAGDINNCEFYDSFEKIAQAIKKITTTGDLIITMGAGDIFKVADYLIS